VRLDVGLRHPLHFRGGERDPCRIVAHVAVVDLAQLFQLVEDLLGAPALVRGECHAAVLEAVHQVALQLGLARVGGARRLHALEELLVLEELGRKRRVFLQARLRRIAHRLVGMHAAEEVDRVDHVLDADLQPVPFREDRLAAAARLELRHFLARPGEALVADARHGGGVVERSERPRGRGRECGGHGGARRQANESSEHGVGPQERAAARSMPFGIEDSSLRV
jgi:hypothetical protein